MLIRFLAQDQKITIGEIQFQIFVLIHLKRHDLRVQKPENCRILQNMTGTPDLKRLSVSRGILDRAMNGNEVLVESENQFVSTEGDLKKFLSPQIAKVRCNVFDHGFSISLLLIAACFVLFHTNVFLAHQFVSVVADFFQFHGFVVYCQGSFCQRNVGA